MNHPAGKTVFADPLTGRMVTRWTAGPAKDQHLYFTSSSVTADDRWLVFLTERDGHPHLHGIERPGGTIRRVSRNTAGLLHAYVYPYGSATGLSRASPVLDPARNRVYWIQDDAVRVVALDEPATAPRRLAPLPPHIWGAFNHVSPDGSTLGVPVTDERAFDPACAGQFEQMRDTVRRFVEGAWKSWILLVDTTTGATTPLCRHDSSSREQDGHVHANTAPRGRSVVFTADRGGAVNVHEVPLDG